MAIVEHDFENGLTVRNGTIAADYKKFYQNVYPAGGPLAGAVNLAGTAVNLGAYQHWTNRDNVFNQTDFVYKTYTGPVFHTVAFGTEFGQQTGVDIRNTGIFPNGTNTIVQNPFAPTYFGPGGIPTSLHRDQQRRRDVTRFQQQIPSFCRFRSCPRHHRHHASSAIDRRRALRSLRHGGDRHEHQHQSREDRR
jgi:hypothetical protein